MRLKLALSITGAHTEVEVVPSVSGRGISRFLPSVFGLQRALPPAAENRSARIEFAIGDGPGVLRSQLEAVIRDLRADRGGSLTGLDLEVRLGQDHAHIGVMVLEDVVATTLSSTQCRSYVQAWMQQVLQLDPEKHLVRWQVLAETHKLLVSCVDRAMFDELKECCLQNRLSFLSCRPAILCLPAQAMGDTTVAWTEAGRGSCRSDVVQLLRVRGEQISSAWRGWIPSPSTGEREDEALEGAIRRFQSRHSAHGEPIKHFHWPAIAASSEVTG